MPSNETRQALALLNEALEIMAAADPSDQQTLDDWKLQNELRALRNRFAAHVFVKPTTGALQSQPLVLSSTLAPC